jgi:four helix bundle protein
MTIEFPYTRLHAYQAATAFVVTVDIITASLPRGRAYLVDRLRRAATSIQANIAEGAGEFSAPDKARFYRMALRSAVECGALLAINAKSCGSRMRTPCTKRACCSIASWE